MHIALIILRADPSRGGAETYSADLAAALARRGHGVTVLTTEFGPDITGVKFVRLAGRSPTRLRRYLGFLDSLDAHLSGHRYDIVHSMLPVRKCDIYHPHAGLAIEALQTGHKKHRHAVRRVISKLGTQLNRKRARFAAIEQDLLMGEKPPAVLCLSNYVKGTILKHYPTLEPNLQTLFNAVDLNRFAPAGPSNRFKILPGDVIALMIAQDFARKGLSRAIRAIALMGKASQSRLRLLVVGKPDSSAYIEMAKELNLGDQVIFAGATNSTAEFYRAADFFVLPTSHDPCSLVVLEALAMGVPVISTVFNGACEIMENERHGFVLKDPDDVAALADAMNRMMNSQLRNKMRAACLELRPRLSFESHVDALEMIYNNRTPR